MINLIFHGRTTAAHQKLIDGQTPDGARVIRRAKGYSDHNVLEGLVRAGWLEPRAAGPRGGTRWFTTAAGAAALMESALTRQHKAIRRSADADHRKAIANILPSGTTCWECNTYYPIASVCCPACCATNANFDLAMAQYEADNS